MTIYIISAIAGAIYGLLTGLLKYIILWRKILIAGEGEKFKTQSFMLRMIIGYVLNAIILLVPYFLRNTLPLDFIVMIVATAIGLSIASKFYSITKLLNRAE